MNNNFLIDIESAARWYKPQTENEARLLELLRNTLPDNQAMVERIEELETELDETVNKLDRVEFELIDYKNFYSDILQSFQDGGVWPDDSPRNDQLIMAICETIERGLENETN